MTNGDYNPSFHPEHLQNDARDARWTIIGLAIAAVLAVVLITLAVRA